MYQRRCKEDRKVLTVYRGGVKLFADLQRASVATSYLFDGLGTPAFHQLPQLLQRDPVLGGSALDSRHV